MTARKNDLDNAIGQRIRARRYAGHPAGEPVPQLGDAYGGGFVSAIIPWLNDRQAIVVAADATDGGDLDDLQWDPKYGDAPGAKSFLDGLANTNAILDISPAAKAARAYRGGGFDDWHIPAHGVQTANLANCCPLWTQIPIFAAGAPQAYKAAAYWSSTQSQFDSSDAWYQGFADGDSAGWDKRDRLRVRPVRIILI